MIPSHFVSSYLDRIVTKEQNKHIMRTEEAVSGEPRYLIGTVTRLTGLTADVVRVWERRYGAVRPARSEGGSRLYSDADIARLRRLRQAVEKGHSISQVAKLSEPDLY